MRIITIKLADGRVISKRVDERGIVPNGGTTGQSLNKLSDTDYDVDWGDASDPRITDSKNPHGHLEYDDTYTILSFNESTQTVTISPVPFSPFPSPAVFKYYIDAIAYETGEQSCAWTDVEGLHFIYLDTDGTLKSTQSFVLAATKCMTAVIYWDATNNKMIYYANERHSVAFGHADWLYKHLTFGTQWRSGAGLADITADGTGNNNTDASFTAETGVIDDEDIRHTLPEQTTYDIFYRLGVSGAWRRSDIATPYGVHFDATRAAWNQFTGGAWQLTTVTNLNFVLAHVFATNNIESPYIVIIGQSQYTTLNSARNGANDEMNNLITAGLPFAEFVPVASIIYQTSTGYSNAVKSRIRSTDTGDNYVNWLGQNLSPTISPAAHNNLTGLQLAGVGVTWGHIDETTFGLIPTSDQNDAIDGSASPSALNVFATMNDLPGDELTADELAAINDANDPSALNVFATMDDLSAASQYADGSGIEILPGSPQNTINMGGTILPGTVVAFDNSSIIFGTDSDIVSGTMVEISDLGGVVSDIILKVGNFADNYAFIQLARSLHAVERIQFDYSTGVYRCLIFFDDRGFVIEDNDTGLDDITARTAGHHGWLPHRKYVDDAIAAAVAGGTGETYAAGDGIIITPGSPDNIISIDLSGDELDAINYANAPSLYNPFATMDDLPPEIVINGNANNYVVTGSASANNLNAESGFQYDAAGQTVAVIGKYGASNLISAGWIIGDVNGYIVPGHIDASESAQGVIELATQAEVDAGTEAAMAVTPATFAGSSTFAVAAKGVTNGDSHDHSGGDGAQIDHAGLANIGTNTHATIDTFITDHGGVRNSKSCTDATITSILKITGLGNTGFSGAIMFSAVATSSTTNCQCRTGMIYFTAQKPVSGNYSSAVGDAGASIIAVTGGTLSVTWAVVDSATESTLRVTCDSSLNVATTLIFQIYNIRGVGTITLL